MFVDNTTVQTKSETLIAFTEFKTTFTISRYEILVHIFHYNALGEGRVCKINEAFGPSTILEMMRKKESIGNSNHKH